MSATWPSNRGIEVLCGAGEVERCESVDWGLLVLLAGPPLAIFIGAFVGDVRQWGEVQPSRYEWAGKIAVGRHLDQHRRLGVEGTFEGGLQIGCGLDPERLQPE